MGLFRALTPDRPKYRKFALLSTIIQAAGTEGAFYTLDLFLWIKSWEID